MINRQCLTSECHPVHLVRTYVLHCYNLLNKWPGTLFLLKSLPVSADSRPDIFYAAACRTLGMQLCVGGSTPSSNEQRSYLIIQASQSRSYIAAVSREFSSIVKKGRWWKNFSDVVQNILGYCGQSEPCNATKSPSRSHLDFWDMTTSNLTWTSEV
jgi:hypothetical protein